jgi:hypothetical integral membrane protein (TIGR02206 family)
VRQFSVQHLAALSLLLVSCVVSVWLARHRPGRWMVVFRRLLAAAIFAGWAGEYVADVILGNWTVRYSLPLQLTDAVSLTSILVLLTLAPLLVELTYFWAFTASFQATLTPDLAQSFPSVYYFTYFTYHIGAVLAAAFLVFGCGLYPRAGAVWRVYLITLAFTALVAVGDLATGGNYMYLRTKPVHSSLLSALGPWPWYIVATAALGLLMLIALDAISRVVRAATGATVVR